jgi:hypothetical protein
MDSLDPELEDQFEAPTSKPSDHYLHIQDQGPCEECQKEAKRLFVIAAVIGASLGTFVAWRLLRDG